MLTPTLILHVLCPCLILLYTYIGEPEMMERLILALGLGSSGWDITPGVPINNCRTKRRLIQNYNVTTPPPPGCGFNRFSRDTEQVCHQWTAEHSEFNIIILIIHVHVAIYTGGHNCYYQRVGRLSM